MMMLRTICPECRTPQLLAKTNIALAVVDDEDAKIEYRCGKCQRTILQPCPDHMALTLYHSNVRAKRLVTLQNRSTGPAFTADDLLVFRAFLATDPELPALDEERK